MRVLFASSSDIGLPSLEAVAARHELVAVLTNPPGKKGRGLGDCESPLADAARRIAPSARVIEAERLGAEARAEVLATGAECMATFSYGRIFGPKFLALFPLGAVNVHPSLLPRWRGCSPLQAAILARDALTGVCVQTLALEVDSGDIIERRDIPLTLRETAGSLALLAARIGAEALIEALDKIERAGGLENLANSGGLSPQADDGVTWSAIIKKDDGAIDWSRGTLEIDAMARAFDPWPGAFTYLNGQKLAILEAFPYPGETGFGETGGGTRIPDAALGAANGTVVAIDKARGVMIKTADGLLAATRLQLQARKPLSFRDFANGTRDLLGAKLGNHGTEQR